jgi:superfamily II DNA or RNA helicase
MIILRDYQQKGVNDIRASYLKKKRAPLYVLPTGGGKTVVFSYIAINTASRKKRVLILVHRIELLRQTSAKLHESGVEHGLINAKFTPNSMASVQVASVQTLVRRLDKVRLDYDLVIIDEAHHATATTWKKILNRIPLARNLGVTATPMRSDGTGLNDMFDDLIVGPSIKELTKRGHLVPSVVYAPTEKLDLSKVRIINGEYDKDEVENIVDNSMITGSAVEYYTKVCPGVPAIAFCVSVKHAEHVAEEFRAAGYKSESVDGTMDDVLRRRKLGGLANGTVQVLTSCDIVSEGTDVPCIVCGILLRPTKSKGLFLQQVGRTLRTLPGKTKAFILDHVGNVLTHGMPDDDQEWSLEGEVKFKKKKNGLEEPLINVRQCPQCFVMHAPSPTCPMCHHVYEIKSVEPPKIQPGELRMIEERDALMIKRIRSREVSKARTYDELARIGADRGYKPGWARHIWEKVRGQKMPEKPKEQVPEKMSTDLI